MKGWDIIGDIHGQSGKLRGLLELLGYEKFGGAWRHPERRVLFLGDYIDRGPDVRGVLHTIRAMVEAGEAVALMGNHELNALHYHTNGPNGAPLRPHTESKTKQHAATLDQFAAYDAEWQDWLRWFARLPVFFETDEFRAIHACWSGSHLAAIRERSLRESDFLCASSDKSTAAGAAMDLLLKGPEVKLPAGRAFKDKDGHSRDSIRVRWWNLEQEQHTFGSLVMPPGSNAPHGSMLCEDLDGVPDYPAADKPVFCGHYWIPYEGRIAPLARNIMCLDYSAGKDGPLVACRWNGTLETSEFLIAGGEACS